MFITKERRMFKTYYYVNWSDDGTAGRIAKFVDRLPYGWQDGQWVFMPSLTKIAWDVTADYDEITEEEAMKLIREKENN